MLRVPTKLVMKSRRRQMQLAAELRAQGLQVEHKTYRSNSLPRVSPPQHATK